MRSVKAVFGIFGVLAPLFFLLRLTLVAGSGSLTSVAGTRFGPVVLGLLAAGLAFSLFSAWRGWRMLRPVQVLNVTEDMASVTPGFDPDAIIARHLARRAESGAPPPDLREARRGFGRKRA